MEIRNSEHYMDTTPYLAMNQMKENPKVGDCFKYHGKTVLVIGTDEKVATILTLLLGSSEVNKTMVHGQWYTNINQISYAYLNNLGEYQFRLTKEEIDSVKLEIVETFDLYDVVEETEKIVTTALDVSKTRARPSPFYVISEWGLDFEGAALLNIHHMSKHKDTTIVDLEKAISFLETKMKYMKGEE